MRNMRPNVLNVAAKWTGCMVRYALEVDAVDRVRNPVMMMTVGPHVHLVAAQVVVDVVGR